MSLAQRLAENLRCSLLRALNEAPGYRANDSLLHDIAMEFALMVSRDQVRTELSWLRDQGLVTLEELASVYIVQITGAGIDVATGNRIVPGVKRPQPR
jgi:DNA-binding transcriptional ArsR family regulator